MTHGKIRIRCPECHAVGAGTEHHLQQPMTCPKCGHTVQMQAVDGGDRAPSAAGAAGKPDHSSEPGGSRTDSPTSVGQQSDSVNAAADPARAGTSRTIGAICLALLAGFFFLLLMMDFHSPDPDLLPLPVRIAVLGGLSAALAYASYRLWPAGTSLPMPRSPWGPLYCLRCGTTGTPKREARGSFVLEALVWLLAVVFAAPTLGLTLLLALIYTLSRAFGRKNRSCRTCGSHDVIPPDSPRAADLQNTHT